jgi:transcriptional regulator with XRE-family HTH domain
MQDTVLLNGQRVKAARKYHGLNQIDFANQVGISQSNLSFIESNRHRTPPETIEKLCQVLQVTPAWLEGTSNDGGVPVEVTSISDSEKEGISKRFREAYERLKTLGIIENDAAFAEFANIPRSTLSLALAGKNYVQLEWVPLLEEKGANRDYIYNDHFPIIRTAKSKKIKDGDDLVNQVTMIVKNMEEELKVLKSYLAQIL